MRLSPAEEAASERVISDVHSVMRNRPEIEPSTLLGSRSTGLATPISDFDFSFTLPRYLPGGWIVPPTKDSISQPSNRSVKYTAVGALNKMRKHFRRSSIFRNTVFVQHARVPIIRCTHVATGLEVQIQTMAEHQAAHEYTTAYLSEFPSLRPLYIVLRYCLEIRNLTTVFEGGLGSYSIFMMIVTALKYSSGKYASDDLGGQLLHVLDFYGTADLYKVGFSPNPPCIFDKQRTVQSPENRRAQNTDPQLSEIKRMQTFYPQKPYLLCLEDPANELNDLGKNAYAIKHIQATFQKIKQKIERSFVAKKSADSQTQGRLCSYLEPILKANYSPFELHRSIVERYANPKLMNDRDYSDARILADYEKRGKQYNVVAEEDDDLQPAPEVIEKNAAKSIKTQDSVSGGTEIPWDRKMLTFAPERTKIREASKKVMAAKKQVEPQKLLGSNGGGFSLELSSLTVQKALLETTAAYKSALAGIVADAEHVPRAQVQSQEEDR